MNQLLAYSSNSIELIEQKNLNPNALAAYRFCFDWLQGVNLYTIKTSGSTGAAKEIQLSREQLIASATNTQNILHYTANDHMHVCLSVGHIGGLMQLVRALHFKLNLYIYEPNINILETVEIRQGNNHISLVPALIEKCIEQGQEHNILKEFSTILIGGAYISTSIENFFKNSSTQVFQTYGMTETCSNIALRNISKNEKSYKFLADWESKIDSQNCLSIHHPTIVKGWINTTDIVEMHNDKTFNIIGRADFIINSGGIKYSPEVLENILNSEGLIQNNQFIISSIPNKIWGEILVLVIESKHIFSEIEKEELLKKANDILSKKIISKVISVQQLIYTNSNKTDRIQIKEYIKNL